MKQRTDQMEGGPAGKRGGAPASPAAQRDSGRLARTAAGLGGFTLLSRLLGLARDMSMAWLLGGGAAADALVAAMRLPHVLRRLLGEGSLSMTLTASLVHLERGAAPRRNSPAPRALASALALRLGLLLALFTLAGLLAAPWLAQLLAPGFSGAELGETVDLLRICLPYALAAGMAALGMAFLHSMGIFWLSALSPSLFNLVMLAAAVAAALGLCPPAYALAVGMLCGGLAQWLAQWMAVRRLLPPLPDGALSPSAGMEGDAGAAAWRCLARLPAGVLGAAAPQLAMLAAMALASGLGRGQVATLYYAERLLELPLGLVGVCLGMASLPTLSLLAAGRQWQAFADHAGVALRLTLLLSLPAAAGLWAVAPALVEGLLQRGAFDAGAARLTALALWGYLPGLPAFACNRTLLAGCNALGQARHTAWSSLWAVAGTLAAGAALMARLPAHVAVMGPALAVSVGLWLQTLLLLRILGQSLRGADRTLSLPRPFYLFRHCLAALAAGLAAWGVLRAAVGWGLWPGLVAAMVCGAAAWLVCLLACGDADLAALRARVGKSRRQRRNAARDSGGAEF